MTYFEFLFHFCYKPLLDDEVRAKGIIYSKNKLNYAKQGELQCYLNDKKEFYSNRLAWFLEKRCIKEIRARLERYFNWIMFDEVQDIDGRDFNFLIKLCESNNNYLMVGDYFQHTFATSHDGNVNKNLYHDNMQKYINKFSKKGINANTSILSGSYRCSPKICDFIKNKLKINIASKNNNNEYCWSFIDSYDKIKEINEDVKIVKLHYKNSSKYGIYHYNWGDVKGIDSYSNVCVVLYKGAFEKFKNNTLHLLKTTAKNRLYVALTRAKENVYLIEENELEKLYSNKN